MHILQTERQGRLVDITEHLAKEGLVGRLVQAQARPRQVITKRHCSPDFGGLPEQVRADLPTYHLQAGVIEGHVMEQQHRDHLLSGLVMGKYQAQQGRLTQIQAVVTGLKVGAQLLQGFAAGGVHGDFLAHQRGLAPDHLQRFVEAFPDDGGAQDIVALDHPLQGLDKRLEARAIAEDERFVQQVRIALPGRQVVVEHTGLQRCQGVDVLDIGRATGDPGDNPIDGFLLQRHQRQHVRGNAQGRAQPVAAMARHQVEQLRLVRTQLLPQRIVQRVIVAQDNQVVLLALKTDRMGGNNCHQFAELHERPAFKFGNG